jgi:hypothetical protein
MSLPEFCHSAVNEVVEAVLIILAITKLRCE